MKKIILIFLLIVFVQQAYCQIFRERHRNTYIGFRAGYSVGTLKGLVYDYPDLTINTVPGYHGGVFISVRIADNFTLEPGVYYSLKGWSLSGVLDDGQGNVADGTLTNKVSYIDAPIMFRVFLKGLNFGIGPQMSLPIKSTIDYAGTVNGQSIDDAYENTEEMNDFDVAVSLSMGYEFAFGLSLNATYDIGITDAHSLYPYPYDFPFWTEAKNRVVKLSIGFIIW